MALRDVLPVCVFPVFIICNIWYAHCGYVRRKAKASEAVAWKSRDVAVDELKLAVKSARQHQEVTGRDLEWGSGIGLWCLG